jgi:replicative DNA helicase
MPDQPAEEKNGQGREEGEGEKGKPMKARQLPANLDAERLVLGTVLVDPDSFSVVAGQLVEADFSMESHRRVFRAMKDVHDRGEGIDRVTLAEVLMQAGQLEAVGGLTFLVSLDEGLPQIYDLESYIRIVRDKATLRTAIHEFATLAEGAYAAPAEPFAVIEAARGSLERLANHLARGQAEVETIGEYLLSEGLDSILAPTPFGVPWPLEDLNRKIPGVSPGELVVIGARPGMGKTSLMAQLAEHAAVCRSRVLFASLEMPRRELVQRMLAGRSQVSLHDMRRGNLGVDERRQVAVAATELADLPLVVDDISRLRVTALAATLQKALTKNQAFGLVVIDYLQLMESGGRFESRVQEISAITRNLKLMAKEFKVPIVVGSQLSRNPASQKRRPELSDLRESGSIEQDADIVVFIHKPAPDEEPHAVELIVAKQRNGPVGTVPAVWVAQYTKFGDESRRAA